MLIESKWYEYDPEWIMRVLMKAAETDPGFLAAPDRIQALIGAFSQCQLKETVLNREFSNNVNFYFVNRTNPNQLGSEWQFRGNETVYTPDCELIFDIMKDGRIGSIEVWILDAQALDL